MARHTDLVHTKQETVTGGHVNYYLVVIRFADGRPDVIVEIEDIIEALNMSFALGNVFKAAVRICKLRQDLGKPGSRPLYEAEKILYYSQRTVAVSKRTASQWTVRFRDKIASWRSNKEIPVDRQLKIIIRDPKRLDPYEFVIADFIDALRPHLAESAVLYHVLMTALLRMNPKIRATDEVRQAELLLISAEAVEEHERLVASEQFQ